MELPLCSTTANLFPRRDRWITESHITRTYQLVVVVWLSSLGWALLNFAGSSSGWFRGSNRNDCGSHWNVGNFRAPNCYTPGTAPLDAALFKFRLRRFTLCVLHVAAPPVKCRADQPLIFEFARFGRPHRCTPKAPRPPSLKQSASPPFKMTFPDPVDNNKMQGLSELIPLRVLFGSEDKSNPRISPDGKLCGFLTNASNGVANVFIKSIAFASTDDSNGEAALVDTEAFQVTTEAQHSLQEFTWSKALEQPRLFFAVDENFHLYGAEFTLDEATNRVHDVRTRDPHVLQRLQREAREPRDQQGSPRRGPRRAQQARPAQV